MKKQLGMAADHAGYELKDFLKRQLESTGQYAVTDFGACSADSCDYPDYAHPLAEALEAGQVDLGIAMCGSGNGVAMTLNKHRGIRAALCWTAELARLARAHNDANVLVLPARFVEPAEAATIVEAFLTTPFDGGRHQRRIEKIPIAEQ